MLKEASAIKTDVERQRLVQELEGIVAVMRPTIYDAAAIAAAIQAQKDAQEDAQAIEGAFSRFFHRLCKAV